MYLRRFGLGVVALAAALAVAGAAAFAQTEKKDEKKPAGDKPAAAKSEPAKPGTPAAKPGDKTAGQPSGMDPEMMKKFAEMSTPGEFHKKLEPLVGSWNCTSKFWMAPGGPAEESSGTLERKWIMDGRFLFEEFKGTTMGMPFQGMGYTGYDNGEKKYTAIWMDTMNTGIFSHKGTIDSAGKVFTFAGENFDCMEGKLTKSRTTLEIVDPSKQIMKMFGNGPDGKEFQNFEMVITRK